VRTPETLRHVLDSSVRIDGVRVGHVTGVLLDVSETRALGLEVTSPDLARRFLPWVAGTVTEGVLEADSALPLVDLADSYVERGAVMCRDPEQLGRLVAVVRQAPERRASQMIDAPISRPGVASPRPGDGDLGASL
jgi:hypothetical protein